MWLHAVVFIITFAAVLARKQGWLHLDETVDEKSMRMFLIAAVCGNILGIALTAANGRDSVYYEGYRLQKETDGSYTQELQVSVDGEDPETVSIQIPEKDSEEETAREETREESVQEAQEKQLLEAIEQYNEDKQDPDYYYLPQEWEEKSLVWSRKKDHSGTLVSALGLLAAFAVMLKNSQERQQKEARRAEALLMDYPSLIMKFTLLVQAGMTARMAFQKIASDYRRNYPQGGRAAYDEILALCHEMGSGVSELEAYRRLGDRCGQIRYKTFSTLLIQNLQKGSRRMADMLEKEAMEAWDERKRKARVLGEAAATKLLVPMVLMLLVVMAVIMIPAFLSFYQ